MILIVSVILYLNNRVITDIDPQDMSIDSSGTKNYSSFLIELSCLVAPDMLPCIEPLLTHLEGEVRV